MKAIKAKGEFSLGEEDKTKYREVINDIFQSGRAGDSEIQAAIDFGLANQSYILCPHTAAGIHTLSNIKEDGQSYICCATAHPGKFQDVSQHAGMQPSLPPQLEGLIGREKRCLRAANDVDAIKAIV